VKSPSAKSRRAFDEPCIYLCIADEQRAFSSASRDKSWQYTPAAMYPDSELISSTDSVASVQVLQQM
jgi:hypothetical protein